MRGKEIMVSLVSPLVFATAVAVPSVQAQVGSDSPPKTAAVPQSVQAPAQHNCSTWLPVDAALLAGVCISKRTGGQFMVNASVHNRSTTHTSLMCTSSSGSGTPGPLVAMSWGLHARWALTLEKPSRVPRAGYRPLEWKWGVARVVHSDAGTQRTVWNPLGIR